ncbi:MAG: radical SAM protein [Treponema sp.]|jgi:MoaA/NifB/PqqE/SkfB family radical SAM enzyme|nr:radical SAM protein [Treponema sp.]
MRETIPHPCFDGGCAKIAGRVHLPVAPGCNIQCNYCRRAFDCVNESRPGVTSKVLTPEEALERFLAVKKLTGSIRVVGIAGPGDALANIEAALQTLRLIREADREVLLCVSTNGLLLSRYARDLRGAGVSHVTVTMNAVNTATARRIYRYVDFEGQRLLREDAAALLLEKQAAGIADAAALGLRVKVNIVLIKDLNEPEIEAIAQKAKDAGAALTNIMQLIPVKGTLFESLPMLSRAELDAVRKKCEAILPQMYHCVQCRADAAGLLGEDIPLSDECRGAAEAPAPAGGGGDGIRVAVASKSGVLVDEHFGHAEAFRVYEYRSGAVRFLEERPVARYCGANGSAACGQDKREGVFDTLADCAAVLALRIGEAPRRALAERGIRAVMGYDYIDKAIRAFVTPRLHTAG